MCLVISIRYGADTASQKARRSCPEEVGSCPESPPPRTQWLGKGLVDSRWAILGCALRSYCFGSCRSQGLGHTELSHGLTFLISLTRDRLVPLDFLNKIHL